MSCQKFQRQLPDLLSSGADLESHPPLQTCPLCRNLVDDLGEIALAAQKLFPRSVDPEDDLNFGDEEDGSPNPGALPVLPKAPRRGPGSAIRLDA